MVDAVSSVVRHERSVSTQRLSWISLIVAVSAIPLLLTVRPAPVASEIPGGSHEGLRTVFRTESQWSRVARAAGHASNWVEGRRRYFDTLVLPPRDSGQLPPAGQQQSPMMSGTVGFLTVQPRTAIGSGVVL